MTAFIDPAGKVFAHLDRLSELAATGTTRAPINAEIDLSNRCSLGCEWCHFAYTHTRGPLAGKRAKPDGAIAGGDLMDTELAIRMVDQLAAAGVRSVTWTGGGEPTLHPAFDEIIEYTATTGLEQGLYTHGGHIDAGRADLLKRWLTFVYVSLDAANAEDYRRHKGVDRFDTVLENLDLLVAAEGDATVGVGFLLNAENWSRCAEMGVLGERIGADFIQFRPVILYDQEHPDRVAEDTAWAEDAAALLEASEFPCTAEFDSERFRRYATWDGHGYQSCWWAALQVAITPNGKVWRCVNRREHAGAEVGDLSVESFADLWKRDGGGTAVGPDCRLMCRGDVANRTLTQLYQPRKHEAFV